MPDYLSQRQNVLTQDSTEKAEFNTYLETVAAKFGLRWLDQTSGNPVQELWQAKHTLATNEMLTLGYAVKNLAQAGPTWTRHQIAQMKTGSIGEQAGAAFELLGLNLFSGPGERIVPAPANRPGFDERKAISGGQITHEKQIRLDDDLDKRKLSSTEIVGIIELFGMAGAKSIGFCTPR